MRKNKLLKLTALVLSAVMLAGAGYTALPVEAEDTISGSYFNFEDEQLDDELTVIGSADYFNQTVLDDTKALNYVGANNAVNSLIIKPPTTDLKPQKVSFRFLYDEANKDNEKLLRFNAVMSTSTDEAKYYERGYGMYFSIYSVNQDHLYFQPHTNNNNCYESDGTTNAKTVSLGTYKECVGEWIDVEVTYDWSGYDIKSYKLTLNVRIVKGGEDVYCRDIIYSKKSYFYTYEGAVAFSNINGTLNTNRYLDNIAVTWTDGTTTYAPTYIPEPKALGATLATTEGEGGSIKTQMGFKFTDARTALEKNNATVSEYGAVFVAGTKDYETMKTNAASVISGTAVDGYVKTVKAEADLPDEYRVTITNSDGENIGKRVTAIGYVKTTDGTIYYTGENTSDDVKQANLNNYSVMSTLKKIFAEKYLADTDKTSLTNALESFNTANGTQYELTDIQNATVDGTTTDKQRTLLKSIHFELYKNYQ